jgi:hypothetical protein
MAKKMLYVSDEDESVWNAVRDLGSRTDASMSKLVTLALSEYVAGHPGSLRGGVRVDGDVPVRRIKNADAPLVKQIRQLLSRYGRDRVALAYARACYEDATRSTRPVRSKVKPG